MCFFVDPLWIIYALRKIYLKYADQHIAQILPHVNLYLFWFQSQYLLVNALMICIVLLFRLYSRFLLIPMASGFELGAGV